MYNNNNNNNKMGDQDEERQRRVRFHGRVQFKTIRHVADFSESEIIDGWYCKKDFMRMSDEVAEIAKLLTQGEEFYKGEELCIRGLEHLVEEEVADYRAEKMVASIDAVLDEQEDQYEANVYDPDLIAEIYAKIVTPLLREAYLVGLRDAKDGAAAAALIPDLSVNETKIVGGGDKKRHEPIEEAGGDIGEKQPNHRIADGERKQRNEEKDIPGEDNGILRMDVEELSPSEEILERYKGSTLVTEPIDDCGEDGDLAFSEHEGVEKLNSSVHSKMVYPEKTTPKAKQSDRSDSKVQNISRKQSGPSEGTSHDPPARKISRRKSAIDRKAGTEMSPFVFRRDGTIGFRNYDVEHRRLEQSKQRKDCIKSALFTFLANEGEEDEDFARFVETNEKAKKEKRSKLYAPSFPNRNKTQSKVTSTGTAATDARSTTPTRSLSGTSQGKLSSESKTGIRGSVDVQKKNATLQGGWSKVVAEK